MRELSSGLTPLYRFGFPALAIAGLAMTALRVAEDPVAFERVHFWGSGWALVGVALVLALYLGYCVRLKRVRLAEDILLISSLGTEIEVPLRDVERVSGSILLDPEIVWLHFRQPTEFGSRVIFMPPFRFFGFLTVHPLVEELRELVRAASSGSAIDPTPSGIPR